MPSAPPKVKRGKSTTLVSAEPKASALSTALLLGAVIIGGASVMVVEILGSRMLAPTFGTTHHVWTALITIALVGLALGYAVGGRVADRKPGLGPLMFVLTCAAVTLLLGDLMTKPVLQMAYSLGMIGGTFVAAAILLLPTLFLLGMVSPMAVRAAADRQHLGTSVGNLYALSTIGSVAGSVAVSLILIPHFSVHTAIAATGVALGLVPICYLATRQRQRHLAALLAVALAISIIFTKVSGESADREIYYKGDPHPVTERLPSAYGDLVVSDFNSTRYLFLNGVAQGSLRGKMSGSPYAYGLGRLVTSRGVPKKVLIWGLGAGIVARGLAEAGSQVTVIEIDPASREMARRFFALPESVQVIIGDARTETRKLTEKFDVVILDAFSGDAPPFHLLTQEAFEAVRDRLEPNGLVALNIVGAAQGKDSKAVASVGLTMEKVFGNVQGFAVNRLLFGRDLPEFVSTIFLVSGPLPAEPGPPVLPHPPEMQRYIDSVFASRFTLPTDQAVVLTDSYAPLDTWSDAAVRAMRY